MNNLEWNVLTRTEAEVISLWQMVHETLASYEETRDKVVEVNRAKRALAKMSRSIKKNWVDLEQDASEEAETQNLLRVVERLPYALDQVSETARQVA